MALELATALEGLRGKKIAVAGDFVLERYTRGRPQALSREAPVLVLRHEDESVIAGGAGRVACLLAAFGFEVVPLGAVGDDAAGDLLLALLSEICRYSDGLLKVRGRASAVQTRILAGDLGVRKQQILRIDRGDARPLDEASAARLLSEAERLEDVAGWVLVDSGYGLLDRALIAGLCEAASTFSFADAGERATDFAGVSHLAVNSREAARHLGRADLAEEDAARAAAGELRASLGLQGLMLTRGNAGLITAGDEVHSLPAIGGEQIVDPSGAGDAVSLAAVIGLASGFAWEDTGRLATLAASLAIMQQGPAAFDPAALVAAAAREGL